MTYLAKNYDELEPEMTQLPNHSVSAFERHIMQCCKAPEWQLRKWLKKVLVRAGFTTVIEDNYESDRAKVDSRYKGIGNLLMIRGNPNVCLASHTDVCREHESLRAGAKYSSSNDPFWLRNEEGPDGKTIPYKVTPIIKLVEHEGVIHRIIQDKECRLQVGGDDRLGVAINTWIALNTGYDLGLYFPTDEEIGLKSARECNFEELMKFDLVCETDRGNNSNQLVIKISNETLCSYDTAVRLLDIAYTMGIPREPVTGGHTDILALRQRGKIRDCVNMTCGYHHSIGSSGLEYIETVESEDTMRYINNIVKDYYLNG